jgi:hypothetical protein
MLNVETKPIKKKSGKITYPYLGENEDRVVLFISPHTGVVLQDFENYHNVGHYSINWSESNFDISENTFILSNE